MRAGKLDRSITIQKFTSTVNDYGSPVESWTDVATLRAQVLQSSTEEFLRGYGEAETTAIILRIRWRDGIIPDNRVVYDGRNLNIREIKEIGRRKGLDLRCEEVRS